MIKKLYLNGKNFFSRFVKSIVISVIFIAISIMIILGFLGSIGNSGVILASGSTTVLPLMEKLSWNFFQNTGTKISVNGGGSSVGINQVFRNLVDVGMASRNPNSTEYSKSNWSRLGTIPIGYDGIVFAVNLKGTDCQAYDNNGPIPGNIVYLDALTIAKIYSGQLTKWNQINENHGGNHFYIKYNGHGNNNIYVVSREEGSGTRDSIYDAFTKYHNENPGSFPFIQPNELPDDSFVENSNGAVVNLVKNTPGAIGYISLGYVSQLSSNMITKFFGGSGKIITPNPLNIFKYGILRDNTTGPKDFYFFWHPMNVIFSTNNLNAKWKDFLCWVFQTESNKILQYGYIPIWGLNSNGTAKTSGEAIIGTLDHVDKISDNKFFNRYLFVSDFQKDPKPSWLETN